MQHAVRSYARTDLGRRRKNNEDAFLCDDDLGLFIVADGMGGHAAGEVASSEAVDTIHGMIKRDLTSLGSPDEPFDEERLRIARRLMEAAIQGATYMVFALSEVDQGKSGMGTTISAALVFGDLLFTGQVGDSRIYQVRDDQVIQVTEDHTLVGWQVKQGLITEEEAKVSPHRNVITRSVGGRDYVEVDTGVLTIEYGDRYLLCSDGLHGYLEEAEIPDVAGLGGDKAIDAFIDLANKRGGHDNITAVLVEVE
ncbi:MAG: serine/threonine-protein phosphatase [Deltaproteobacteria bacterium]|nr:serine/threonine-protein phosphatase [Deltaproteobacteria bacterium]MBW2530842.1 serine/threonine-protein phosphatase [Deltaproteobacteria bacterium]